MASKNCLPFLILMKLSRGIISGILIAVFSLIGISGCYKRSTAPSYEFDTDEVVKIRDQLGARTAEKEFVNEEEEDE